MFFQALTFDISVITVSSTGRVLFYDQNSNLVVAIKKTDDFQLHYSENFLYIWKEGNKPVWVNGGTEMTMASGSLYKMTVYGLTDIDGKAFTALSETGDNYEEYLAKQQEAFEWLQEVVLAGCCNGGSGSSSVAFYDDFASFPTTGTVDVLYVDKATPALYIWDGAAYVAFGSGSGVASVTGNIVDNTDPSNPVVTQVQADWDEADNTLPSYILNKPDLDTLPYIPLAGTEVDSPVTGDIEIGGALLIRLFQDDGFSTLKEIVFYDDNTWDFKYTDGTSGYYYAISFQGIRPSIYSDDPNFNIDPQLTAILTTRDMKSRIWTKAGTPTTTDDSADGYLVGSLIWDTTNSLLYKCTDNTAGAATWDKAVKSKSYLGGRNVTSMASGASTYIPIYQLSGATNLALSNDLTNFDPRSTVMDVDTTFLSINAATGGSQPASGSFQVILVVDGVDSSLVLTVPAGSAIGHYSATGSVVVPAGSKVAYKFKNNATATGCVVSTVRSLIEI